MSGLHILDLGTLFIGIACLALLVCVFLRTTGWKSPPRWIAIAIAVIDSSIHGWMRDNWGEEVLLGYRAIELCALISALLLARRKRVTPRHADDF
ncbi:hypothetical protein GCM10010193_07940 [Kitasatospora atroaurantiaca]|uniref:Uncharacterized protein n=1 Tax=Kitasatospora atroaurantiaca TaxID=285545 RepID=A0A561EJK4_9ACTN|nr:hypothetical protein [Kitasatospora atroaurantiaca]TWE15752.1 hypothetical protein FB465_0682 [Kitasatospora atroaurantiaca]